MTETIEDLFIYIATFAPLVPIVIYLKLFYKNPREVRPITALKLVVLYCSIELFVNAFAFFLDSRGSLQASFLKFFSVQAPMRVIRMMYSIFTIIEYSLFAGQLYLLIKSAFAKRFLLVLSGCFFAFWLLFRIYGKYDVLDSVPIGVETLLILVFAFQFLFEQMDNIDEGFIYNRFTFWIASGSLIYLSGSLFCYLYANQVSDEVRGIFWMFQNIFATMKTIFFTIAILIAGNSHKSRLRINTPNFTF